MDIDLTTDKEIEFRFEQLCTYFRKQVRDETYPQRLYLELYLTALLLKEKYCPIK